MVLDFMCKKCCVKKIATPSVVAPPSGMSLLACLAFDCTSKGSGS